MDAKDVIERLCKLQAEVVNQIRGDLEDADCFCGTSGYWGSKSYGGTFAEGYRNGGKALEFIEQATREKLASLRATTETCAHLPKQAAWCPTCNAGHAPNDPDHHVVDQNR